MGIFDILGTTASGWLTDKIQSRYLLLAYYLLRGISLLFLPYALAQNQSLNWFAIFYGLDWVATVPPTVKLTADCFGRQNAGVIYGWIAAAHQLGAALAAAGAGLIRTQTGHYQSAFWISGLVCSLTGLAFLFAAKPLAARTAYKSFDVNVLSTASNAEAWRVDALPAFALHGSRNCMTMYYNVWHANRANGLDHLPPDLLVKAQELAHREHRTMSELFREALRRYMATDKDWDALLKRTRAKGIALGITSEADVERLSDDFRRDMRKWLRSCRHKRSHLGTPVRRFTRHVPRSCLHEGIPTGDITSPPWWTGRKVAL
jgi:hypothetical protein